MGMSIDEAIKHCEEVAKEQQLIAHNLKQCRDYGNPKSTITSGVVECETSADEHRQLAKWLRELRAYRNMCHADNIDFAIDTMRKYQKIEQIVKAWNDMNPFDSMVQISEVVEDE